MIIEVQWWELRARTEDKMKDFMHNDTQQIENFLRIFFRFFEIHLQNFFLNLPQK